MRGILLLLSVFSCGIRQRFIVCALWYAYALIGRHAQIGSFFSLIHLSVCASYSIAVAKILDTSALANNATSLWLLNRNCLWCRTIRSVVFAQFSCLG